MLCCLSRLPAVRCSIAHRDVKTANVLLTRDLHCKLADFDMATAVPYTVHRSCGTPGFMAPEMLAFEVSVSSPVSSPFPFGMHCRC